MSTLNVNNINKAGGVDAIVTDGVAVSVPSGNAIINGDFGVWQRGTSFSSPPKGSYTADRFAVNNLQAVERSTDVPNGFEYSAKLTKSSGSFGSIFIRIEAADSARFVGKKVTYSFWVKPNQEMVDLFDAFVYLKSASSKDDFSTTVTVDGGEVYAGSLIVDTWTRISVTSTDVLPSAAANGIEMQIFMNRSLTPTSDVIGYFTGVQLEAGSVATPFRLAGGGSKGAELALCSRYYLRITGQGVGHRLAPAGYNENGTTTYTMISGPQPFRATPSVSHQNVVIRYSGASIVDISTITPQFASNNLASFYVNAVSSVLPTGGTSQLRTPNSGDYIELDCEL